MSVMKFLDYYHEKPNRDLNKKLQSYRNYRHKIAVWNTFVDSGLPDITEDDFSIIPRVLPASYLPTLKRSAYLVTLFAMRLLSLPEREIRAIIPKGPTRDHLLDQLEVLKFHRGRITGSFRFDMAVVGPPDRHHPPILLEINEIGFDGLSRSTYFQNALLSLMPEVRGRLKSLDTAAAEVRNMQRLGNKFLRLQYDDYNWDEQVLYETAKKMGSELRLVTAEQFKLTVGKESPLLEKHRIDVVKKKVTIDHGWKPDAVNFSFAYALKDYQECHPMYRSLVESTTPQYGPFLTGLIAAKTILVLLDDPLLRKKLLGSSAHLAKSILPAHILGSEAANQIIRDPQDWVIKHTDGCGGAQVFMDQELRAQLKKIPPHRRHEWVLQKKTKLNLIDIHGILSRPKQAIGDLGVFVQYDWADQRFLNFEVGGLMCRATNKSLKVNVSSGGSQVAVLLDRAT